MTSEPVPQRISDADRDAAVEMLREHYEAGRLDESEFEDRMATALAARIASDLDPLFADLPEPRPQPAASVFPGAPSYQTASSQPAPSPVPQTRPDGAVAKPAEWIGMAQALIWPVAIGLMFLTRGGWYWIFIAIVVSIILGQLRERSRRQPPPY
ncbi:DUF1707 SHOCT-like domain-containing protein [Nigerium massiliense]|uniref:DUF1707 SHOCT-like domain-containing protein n=1 Tax=Nigerium massiliense TaxID=1522317 RepID=UPI0006938384|nr:DUF1707 domain-containing protein [Nigerium massiliense]